MTTATKQRPRRVHPAVPDTPSSTDTVDLLRTTDWVLINSSGGKDSQAMAAYLVGLAARLGMLHKVVVVHADLGTVEWAGTRQLAEQQARLLGVRFEVVQANGSDLLGRTRARYIKLKAKALAEGKPVAPAWPSSSARWCTSDLKRGPVRTLMTRLVAEVGDLGHPVRILNCLGQRAAESPHRAGLAPVEIDRAASNGRRTVTTLRPIHGWTDHDVWAQIAQAPYLPYHPAYDWGMRRLSCSFCVLASESDLVLAARLRPGKAAEYAATEQAVERDFKASLSMATITARAAQLDRTHGRVRRAPRGTAMTAHLGPDMTRTYLRNSPAPHKTTRPRTRGRRLLLALAALTLTLVLWSL
ncbi:phosphoadenosine phosphosulfate reductase domain-containing protein [Streptomyces hydrogenans]|uniref:phosphoadenosine phosphosulfate reductase domain-containing protein n=1 Tax=Streptomyces hydrogenans TaxID=1873719 RepID=UPI003816C9DA